MQDAMAFGKVCRGFLEILCVLKTPEVSGMLDLDEEEDDEM